MWRHQGVLQVVVLLQHLRRLLLRLDHWEVEVLQILQVLQILLALQILRVLHNFRGLRILRDFVSLALVLQTQVELLGLLGAIGCSQGELGRQSLGCRTHVLLVLGFLHN